MHGKWSQILKKIGSDNEFDTIGSFDRIHLDPKRLWSLLLKSILAFSSIWPSSWSADISVPRRTTGSTGLLDEDEPSRCRKSPGVDTDFIGGEISTLGPSLVCTGLDVRALLVLPFFSSWGSVSLECRFFLRFLSSSSSAYIRIRGRFFRLRPSWFEFWLLHEPDSLSVVFHSSDASDSVSRDRDGDGRGGWCPSRRTRAEGKPVPIGRFPINEKKMGYWRFDYL